MPLAFSATTAVNVTALSTVFRDIAEAEKRGVRFGGATEVKVGGRVWKSDVHVCLERKEVSCGGVGVGVLWMTG